MAVKYQKFRDLRKRNLYTCESLGKELGVTGALVSYWETGASKPQLEILPDIARVLNTNVNTLLKIFYGLDLSEN